MLCGNNGMSSTGRSGSVFFFSDFGISASSSLTSICSAPSRTLTSALPAATVRARSAVKVVRPSLISRSWIRQSDARMLALPDSAAGASAPGMKPNQLASSPACGAENSKVRSGPLSIAGGCSEP